jgi:hypothetical protein
MENEVVTSASAGYVLAGFILALFLGFLANRIGYLSVHKRAPKEGGTGGSTGGGGGSRPKVNPK